jgi:preprotein translocase subunit SecE
MSEISKTAHRYAVLLYVLVGSYIWYLSYSLWLFLGKHYFPQDVSSILSVQNGQFHTLNIVVASGVTVVGLVGLVLYKRLREFFVDVGDELSRVSWPTWKEAQKSTFIVILLVIVAGMVLFLADALFLKLIHLFMSTAS